MARILFITHTPPWPVSNGGHQRTNLLLRALSTFAEVDLVLLPRSAFRYPAKELELLRRDFRLRAFVCPRPWGKHWPWCLARPFWPKAVDVAAQYLGRGDADYAPDAGVARWLEGEVSRGGYGLIVGRYLRPTIRSGALGLGPTVVDVDDVDTDRIQTELENADLKPWRRLVLERRHGFVSRVLPEWLPRAAHLWVCSESDRRRLGPDRATVLPNIPYVAPGASLPEPCPHDSRSRTVLIVGSLKYLVNERGVDRFLQQVWPEVHRACPEAVFRIVGAGMTPAERRRWGGVAGVEPVGFAENLRDEYARAAFTVAPVFEGGGTKIKVLESLAFGRTCVLTRHAHRGFEHVLRHAESLWVGDDDAELAQGCVELLRAPDRAGAMAEVGQRLVAEHFTFDRFRGIVEETVRNVLARHNGSIARLSVGEDARTPVCR